MASKVHSQALTPRFSFSSSPTVLGAGRVRVRYSCTRALVVRGCLDFDLLCIMLGLGIKAVSLTVFFGLRAAGVTRYLLRQV